jgi:hypothetical protein
MLLCKSRIASRITLIFESFVVKTRSFHASSNLLSITSLLIEPSANLIVVMHMLTGTPAAAAAAAAAAAGKGHAAAAQKRITTGRTQ